MITCKFCNNFYRIERKKDEFKCPQCTENPKSIKVKINHNQDYELRTLRKNELNEVEQKYLNRILMLGRNDFAILKKGENGIRKNLENKVNSILERKL